MTWLSAKKYCLRHQVLAASGTESMQTLQTAREHTSHVYLHYKVDQVTFLFYQIGKNMQDGIIKLWLY
ncbi:hypothetical protein ACN42_g1594 [Penicillium freii]|uniref:Uncharacterized protein n=1 Tax=Penicillium freii TaxID=48697 RepID=A0A101MRL6_PENFR|nr:hypothetical protein ACN42_g1594 [Penicillium freii]